MKITLVILLSLLASCNISTSLNENTSWFSVFRNKEEPKPETYRSRITYYSVGEDKWGDKVACPKTHRAKQGITIAAHPKFPFGTKVSIPELKGVIGDGTFIVQDRGSAVTSKKAAKGKAFVFDVFVKSKAVMRAHANNRQMYMDVSIITDK